MAEDQSEGANSFGLDELEVVSTAPKCVALLKSASHYLKVRRTTKKVRRTAIKVRRTTREG
jgi:hypothetical protein